MKQIDPEYEAVLNYTPQHTHNALLKQLLNSEHRPVTTERVSVGKSCPNFRWTALGLNPDRNLLT
jgi:hypothetical protein